MARVKIKFPEEKPLITVSIPVRISDINYGGHVGNDSLLTIIHEARMMLLGSGGHTEMKAAGTSLIMADVMIAYKGEAFYNDILDIDIYAEEFTNASFSLLYKLTTARNGISLPVADCKTGMVCYNYDIKKIDAVTADLKLFLTGKL
ncbi:MAG: acyl-CoA thioesterase [Taibaiella sp.]|nr:acyl-CoA thioesterase [Taibaiella sp.]